MAGEIASNVTGIAVSFSGLLPAVAQLTPLWVVLAAKATGADVAMRRVISSAATQGWSAMTAGIGRAAAVLNAFGYELGKTGSLLAATRAGLVATGVSGTGAFAAIAAAARTAGAAIVSAFGPVTWAIAAVTYAIQKAFEWFTKMKMSAQEAAAAIKSSSEEFNADVERARGISSESDRQAFLEDQRKKLAAAKDKAREAMSNEDDNLAGVYDSAARAIEQLIAHVEKMPVAAIKANGETAASAKEMADAYKDAEAALKKYNAAVEAEKPLREQRRGILKDLNFKDSAALDRRISYDQADIAAGTAKQWQIDQLPKMVEAREKLRDLEKQIAAEQEKKRGAVADRAEKRDDWKQRQSDDIARNRADATGNEEELERVRLEQRRRDLIKEGQEIGRMSLADAQAYAATVIDAEKAALDAKREQQRLAEKERADAEKKSAEQWRADFELEMRKVDAELRGDKSGARNLEIEQRRQGYIREGIERGGLSEADATKLANQRAALDAAKLLAGDQQKGQRSRVDALFADSLARVGGGGGVAGKGGSDPLLRENERQSSLLTSLVSEIRGLRDQVRKGGGKVIAVAA